MELTIDQLAQRVDMSTRNIREWQRLGLLAPPARRGRVGIYSDEHVLRIERVKALHARGLPLDLIRRLSETASAPEADVRHLADEVLNPISVTGSAVVSLQELADRVGADALDALSAAGLIADGPDDTVTVRDVFTLDAIEELGTLGISTRHLVTALTEVQRHQREIARLIIDVYREDVWQPFLTSGFATQDWASLADGMTRAKPLAIRLLAHLLDTALDDVAGTVLLREAGHAERALDHT